MTTQSLREHAIAIAKAIGVRLIETDVIKPDEAFAVVGPRLVVCHPIIEETTYAVVLHEVGHLAAPGAAFGGSAEIVLAAERAAWTWARAHALEWTPTMDALATWCESTYAKNVEPTPTPEQPATPVVPARRIKWSDYE